MKCKMIIRIACYPRGAGNTKNKKRLPRRLKKPVCEAASSKFGKFFRRVQTTTNKVFTVNLSTSPATPSNLALEIDISEST